MVFGGPVLSPPVSGQSMNFDSSVTTSAFIVPDPSRFSEDQLVAPREAEPAPSIVPPFGARHVLRMYMHIDY